MIPPYLPKFYTCKGRIFVNGAYVIPEVLTQGWAKYAPYAFDSNNSRVRRYAPGWSGNTPTLIDQNGFSIGKTWYAGESRWIHNGIDRHLLTCFMRFREGSAMPTQDGDYGARIGLGTGSLYYRLNGTQSQKFELQYLNPQLITQFHCGRPNEAAFFTPVHLGSLSSFPTGGMAGYQFDTNYLREDAALPWGFANTHQHTGGAVFTDYTANQPLGPFNEVMSMGIARSEVGNEALAIKRLRSDLYLEPYRLLDNVVANNLSFKTFFNANYTLGHAELRLLYQTNGLSVPARPSNYSFRPFNPNDPIEKIAPGDPGSGKIHSNMVTISTTPDNLGNNAERYRVLTPAAYLLPPRPAAGVLSMPSFITPVGVKMRTLASRYFTRLLCGDPTVFVPSGGEVAIHESHMVNPVTNPEAAKHFETHSTCRACHINLDPLGAALGSSFLGNVQKPGGDDLTGEMSIMDGILGVDFSGPKGVGAFLGAEVTGLEGVASQLVTSDKWSSCVVQKTFGNVFGRVPKSKTDLTAIATWSKQFSSDFQYNALVRSMVSSKLYQGDN